MSLVDETGIDPSWLVLEITESALVEDVETALRRLGQLAATGVRIALDDFGTGYSSLSYLRRMPIHMLKIDKSFIDDLTGDDGRGEALLRSIVGIARSLGLQSVAEGIETAEQAAVMRDLGCTLGQGYLFSRPVTAHQIREQLRAERRLPGQRSAAERRSGATFS
jgi:EAL domain-containing protein (putative c-di-GMP-specific phosphodiesterase class I)